MRLQYLVSGCLESIPPIAKKLTARRLHPRARYVSIEELPDAQNTEAGIWLTDSGYYRTKHSPVIYNSN